MSMSGIEAWTKMADTYFSAMDREKVEWCIGAVLAGGPRKILTVTGAQATGKSTILKLAKRIIDHCSEEDSRRAVFLSWDRVIRPVDDEIFVFVEANNTDAISSDSIIARTSDNQFAPGEHLILSNLTNSELGSVGLHCLRVYRKRGKSHFDNINQGEQSMSTETIDASQQPTGVFDKKNPNWSSQPGFNRLFVQVAQGYANDMLRVQGFLPLNEVYKLLGLEQTEEGALSGWVGNVFVDCGVYAPQFAPAPDAKPIALTFNINSTNVFRDK